MSRAATPPVPALYFGHVMHCRLRPFRHRFVYRVFSLFADIDSLDLLSASSRLFSHNRFNLFSVMDRDHGAADGSPIRPWIEAQLAKAGLSLPHCRIYILCFPRMFGYVFNPLTVFFCYDADAELRALIYEVRNTFGEKHPYVVTLGGRHSPDTLITHQRNKEFYVSPFIEMNMRYTFRLRLPGKKLSLMIREHAPEGEVLIATLTGGQQPFNDRMLLKALFLYPFMSLKVIAAIHFEAWRLWRKGAKLAGRRPAAAE